jgi:hypothetical protein
MITCHDSFSHHWPHCLRNPLGPRRHSHPLQFQARTCADNVEKPFLKRFVFLREPATYTYTGSTQQDSEIDELVDEWTPELLPGTLLTPEEQNAFASVPIVSGANGSWPKLLNTGKQVLNIFSYNFMGLASNEPIRMRAIETLRKYGVGSCRPPRFYGTIGASVCYQFPAACRRPQGL